MWHLLSARHCLHIRGLGSKLTLVPVPEEQELNDYRLTQPNGWLAGACLGELPESYGNGVKGSE